MKKLFLVFMVCLAMVVMPGSAYASDGLDAAKASGFVGERLDGMLGYVSPSVPPNVRTMVESINTQRRQRYAEVARKNGTVLSKVQAVAGAQLIERSPKGYYVMNKSGEWVKK